MFLPKNPARLGALVLLIASQAAFGQFAPGPNPITGTVTTAQTITTGTGTVNGNLSVTGNNVAITVKGSSTIVNNGTIQQTSVLTGGNAGNGRAIRDNTGNLTLTITNGSATNSAASIVTADGDDIQMNKAGSTVTLNNYGLINSQNASGGGNQAIDWNALNTTTGTNTLNNFSTGVITATNADAVRPGVNGLVFNDGIIKSIAAPGSSSDGIDAQTNSGISITNANTVSGALIEGARHGITGGNTTTGVYSMTVVNNTGGTIQGDDGSGINIDGINNLELVTVTNSGTITGNGVTHDGDGVDVDGLVNINNSGTIKSLNSVGTVANPETSEGVTVGGGTIINSGTIEGDVASGNNTAIGRGITLAGVDKDSNDNPIPIQGIYGNTVVTNSGSIKGQSDSGIAVLGPNSGFSVTINNLVGGTIEGAGSNATLRIDNDNATITNAGSIINDGGNFAAAVSLGSGNSQLKVVGNQASIIGGINGGSGSDTLTFDLGSAFYAFSQGGSISNFSKVEVLSGNVTLNGNNTYAGITNVGGSAGASLTVDGIHTGGGTYTVASGGTLGGTGTLNLATASTEINIQNGGTLHLTPGAFTVGEGSLDLDGLLKVEIDGGSPGVAGGYGQLEFASGNSGTVTFGADSQLELDFAGFSPTFGEQFDLIGFGNSGGSYNGTIDGLAQGSIFTENGTQFQVSYTGGSGHDFVLTDVSSVPDTGSTVVLAGMGLLGLTLVGGRRLRAQRAA